MQKVLFCSSIFLLFLRSASEKFLNRWWRRTTQHFWCLWNLFLAVSRSFFYKWRGSWRWMFCRVTFFNELIHGLSERRSVVIDLFCHWIFKELIIFWLIFVSFCNPFINQSFVFLDTFLFILWNVQINLFYIFDLIRLIELTNVWMIENLFSC